MYKRYEPPKAGVLHAEFWTEKTNRSQRCTGCGFSIELFSPAYIRQVSRIISGTVNRRGAAKWQAFHPTCALAVGPLHHPIHNPNGEK